MNNIFVSEAINDYPFAGADLNGCVNDQVGIATLLKNSGISIEIDTHNGSESIHDEMLKRIRYYASIMKDGSFTWHYSGHGTYGDDPFHIEPDGLREGLFPYDGKIVWDYELIEAFSLFSPKVDLLILLDCCFSGGMSRFLTIDPLIKSRFYQTVSRPRGLKDRSVTEKINGVLISGSQEDQTSADAFINGKYWGAFSYYSIKTFRLGISKREWHSETLNALVKAKRYEQRPQLLGTGNPDTGCFGQPITPVSNKGCIFKFLPI